ITFTCKPKWSEITENILPGQTAADRPDLVARVCGIEYVFTYQVDNPMVNMCDPAFVGFHIIHNSDFSSKATPKNGPDEKVGVFCRSGSETRVVEYTELGEEEREARDENGKLRFSAGNIAVHVVSTDFLFPDDGESAFEMPYHVAKKAISYIRDGEIVESAEPNSIRFESFLFDVLPLASNPVIMEVLREREFAPVKNLEGSDSPDTARALMQVEWARWLEEAGVNVPRNADGALKHRIEISPLYATTPEELADRIPDDLSFDDDLLLE
ncbi:MAG: UTP--glucose-1-phosphate uridylyltransferase, partial [Planctomycetota bacterium]